MDGKASISAYNHDFMGIVKERKNPPRKNPDGQSQSIHQKIPCILPRVKSKTVMKRIPYAGRDLRARKRWNIQTSFCNLIWPLILNKCASWTTREK